MNDINKMPPVCAYCPYWEVCKPPYICASIEDKKPKRTETHGVCLDAISRQDAIDLLEDLETKRLQGDIDLLYAPMMKGLKELPSVKTDHIAEVGKMSAQPLSSCAHENDTISRQEAIDALGEKPLAWIEGEYETGLQNQWESDVEALKDLPSVKPDRKRGHWVGIDDEPCETWECDNCGCIQECFDGEKPNYCPHCGADMRGEQDGRDS